MSYFNRLNSVGNGRKMVRVHPASDLREAIEVQKGTQARAIDSLIYNEEKRVVYLTDYANAKPRNVEEFGPYAWLELETGFEEEAGQKTIVCMAAKP